METFLKMLPLLLLLTPITSLNADLQLSTSNSIPSTPDLPNVFSSQSSPQPNIGVNGRGIFTGAPLASRRGPRVILHSYPWFTYNNLVNADNNAGKTLVYNEDTSFSLPLQNLDSPIPRILSVPSIPAIPNLPKLPNFPKVPTIATPSRKTRSIITPQIIQAQTSPNIHLGNQFSSPFYPQFPSFPFAYPIPYTIITQVIPVFPAFGVAVQPPMPVVSGEASGAGEIKETPVVKPEIETGGEFSGATEIEGPYPDPLTPETVAEGEFVREAEIEGPYPDPAPAPEVGGDASGEAILASYPAAVPETVGDAIMSGPYPAAVKPVVSGEASGAAILGGPYPAAIQPEVSSETKGPYPIAKPVVTGEASGGNFINVPYQAAIKKQRTSSVRLPNSPPVKSIVNGGVAIKQGPPPVFVKPFVENPSGSLKEFLLEMETPAKVEVTGKRPKGPYLIPKTTTEVNLDVITKPVVPAESRESRVSYAARLREAVYPEYFRDASGRIVRFN